jgi:hypothetical protein
MIGGDRFNRMAILNNNMGAGQGGSRVPMPAFGKASSTQKYKPINQNGFFDAIGGIAENIYAGNLADENVENNQGIFDQQIEAAQGGNIEGIDGSTYFDPVTKTYKQKLSDRRDGMLTGFYNQVEGYNDQLASMNPYEYADYMYNQASGARNLSQDREKAQVLEMMNARGIDVSDVGNNMFGSTVQNQNFANAAERAGYISQGQDIRNQIVANQNAAIANIYGQDAINSQQINDARNMGVNVTPPAGLSTAYNNQMDAKAQGGGALADILGIAGNAIAPGIGGFLGKAVGGLFS